MLKRVILVGTTLACVLLGLFLYQQSSDTFDIETLPAPPSPASRPLTDDVTPTSSESNVDFVPLGQGVSVRKITGLKFITRNKQGRISNEFGFEQRRVNQAGEHEFDKPWIKFYEKKQLIKMTADVLTSPVETQGQLPESGWLEGKVQIEWFRIKSPLTDSVQEEPGQRVMLVELERVNFRREFSRIHSPGTVKISSASFNASGSQLTIRYDPLHSRLAELELRHLDSMEYLSGQRATSSNRTDSPAAPTSSAQATLPSSKQAQVYRLSLVDKVIIHQGNHRIEADRIEILATDLPFSRNPQEKPSSDVANKASSASPKEPTTTTLTCSGPLRIVPEESNEHPESSQNLQVYLFGKPIRLWQENHLSLVASTMSYDPSRDTVNLKGTPNQPLRFMLETNPWTSVAQEAQWDRPKGLVVLNGPGQIINPAVESDQPFKINYQDTLKIKLDPHEQMEWIELNGHVQAWSNDLAFTSDHLTAPFEQNENGKNSPKLIRAEGSTFVETTEYIVESGEMLEITFEPPHKRGEESPDVHAGNDSGLNALFSRKNNLHSVLATGPDGSVRITDKTQKIRIVGDRLEGNSLQQYWTIHGRPARIENLDKDHDFQTMESAVIIADLPRNQYKIPGSGSLTTWVQNNRPGSDLNQETPATIHWNKGAIYNLENRRIELKDVFITMHEQGSYSTSQTEITTAALHIVLAEESDPNSSTLRQNIGRLSTLIAPGPEVHLIRKETNRLTHEPVSLMEIRSTRLKFDHATRTVLIHGAGWLEMTHFVGGNIEAKEQQARSWQSERPMYTLIRFTKTMRYQIDKDQITLTGHVMVDQIPLVTDGSMDYAANPKIEGMKQLTCNTLSFAISHAASDESGSTSSPALTQSLDRLDYLSAEGNIFFETFLKGQHHTFTAQGLTFEKKINLAIFQGTRQVPVRFNQIRFSQVLINVQTGDIDTKPVGHSEMANQF